MLVYDFGGGTLDLAILKNENRNFETVAIAGNPFCGGQDIDNLLIKHFVGICPYTSEATITPKQLALFK